MGARAWVKLWTSWYISASHEDVSADALHIGPVLMTYMRWAPGVDQAWAEKENGKPISTAAIARRAKWPETRARKALLELVDAGTVALRNDGTWGFPKFGFAQESADAARKRKVRGHSGGQSTPVSGGCPDEGEAEAEGEADAGSLRSHIPAAIAPADIPAKPILALAIPANDPPRPKKGGKSKPRTDYPEGLAEHFLTALQTACETLGKRGPRKVTDHHRDHLRKLYAAQEPTPEDIAHVVAVRRAMDARGEAYGSLTWESICVPANFARWLASPLDGGSTKPARDADAPFGRRPSTGKPYTSAQDREEWQRVDAANARRTEALRGGG